MDSDGYGLGVLHDMPLLVNGALPGELVKAKVVFAGKREAFADTVKVLRPAASRLITPPCPNARFCDGCPMVAMQYQAQLAWKEALVKEEITRYASLAESRVHEILPSPCSAPLPQFGQACGERQIFRAGYRHLSSQFP